MTTLYPPNLELAMKIDGKEFTARSNSHAYWGKTKITRKDLENALQALDDYTAPKAFIHLGKKFGGGENWRGAIAVETHGGFNIIHSPLPGGPSQKFYESDIELSEREWWREISVESILSSSPENLREAGPVEAVSGDAEEEELGALYVNRTEGSVVVRRTGKHSGELVYSPLSFSGKVALHYNHEWERLASSSNDRYYHKGSPGNPDWKGIILAGDGTVLYTPETCTALCKNIPVRVGQVLLGICLDDDYWVNLDARKSSSEVSG